MRARMRGRNLAMFRDITKSRRKASHSAITYLALYGLAIALPLVLLLGALLIHSASLEQEQLEHRLLQIVDDLADRLDRDFDRHLTILQTIATFQSLKSEDWPIVYEQAKAALQGRGYIILIDSAGRQLVNTYVPFGEQPARTGDLETLRRILETRGPIISNLFTSLVVKQPVYNVSIPILRDDQVQFVLSLGLLPSDLATVLVGQKLGAQWVTMVWDANGVILARSRNNERYVGTTVPAQMLLPDQRAVFRTTNLDGIDVLQAVARSRLASWAVAVNVPYSLIVQDWRTSMFLWAAVTVLSIALALMLGLLVARYVTMPLSIASSAAAALGRGQLFTIRSSSLKEADIFLNTLATAQQQLAQRTIELKRAEEQFRLVVEAAPNGMILANSEGQIVLINDRIEKMFGYRREELIGQGIDLLVPDQFRRRHPDYRASYLKNPSMRPMGAGRDLFARRNDGTEIPIEIGLSSISTVQGSMSLCAIVDITERKAAQDREKILIREVEHRSSNLLSVIQAIAHRSLTGSPSLEQARDLFVARLRALARTNRQLTQSNFVGMNLDEIVHQELEPYAARMMIDGPKVRLDAQLAQDFTLAVHELATNALKYGALSNPTGTIGISWAVTGIDQGKILRFKWQERGGPPVATPDRRGFGTSLLKTVFRDIDLEFASEGFRCEIVATIREIEPGIEPPTHSRSPERQTT